VSRDERKKECREMSGEWIRNEWEKRGGERKKVTSDQKVNSAEGNRARSIIVH
jgi:hypothetical protein